MDLVRPPDFFTKLFKPILALLNYHGIRHVSYLDDMLLMNQCPHELKLQTSFVCKVLMYLGFLLNLEKSVVEPTQKITFLGFELNTKTRTISIPDDKLQGITQHCKSLLGQQSISLRAVAKVVGRLQATRLAITPGPLYYRGLQRLLPREQVTNWEVKVSLSTHARADLTWWI